ncbi:MAG: DUF438 domain-containing protein [Clostridiaceae bacterium]
MERKEKLKNLIKGLHDGMSQDEAREIFIRDFGKISGDELSQAEKQLVEEGLPISEIQRLCDIHASVFEDGIMFLQKPAAGKLPLDETPGHPAFVFKKENDGIDRFLKDNFLPAIAAYEQNGDNTQLIVAAQNIAKISKHYKRKENLFFPFLEREGVTAPPKVMWGVDDEIRDSIRNLNATVEDGNETEVIALAREVAKDVSSMITKENNILIPMMLEKFNDEDWKLIARDSQEIGYVFTGDAEGAAPSDAVTWFLAQTGDDSTLTVEADGGIKLPSGFFNVTELEAVLNSLPADLTFVGADDRVHYFSEGKTRVFPRTRSIIGREVSNCHPPKSLHVVESLIQDFKDGLKDEENFWIQKDGMFILIRYYAVRDKAGTYLGVVEVTEEISGLRALDGSKTLASE